MDDDDEKEELSLQSGGPPYRDPAWPLASRLLGLVQPLGDEGEVRARGQCGSWAKSTGTSTYILYLVCAWGTGTLQSRVWASEWRLMCVCGGWMYLMYWYSYRNL